MEGEAGQRAGERTVPQGFQDLKLYGAGVADAMRHQTDAGVKLREAAGPEKADVDFRRAITIMDASAPCDRAVEVAGGEQEQAAGLQQPRDLRQGRHGLGQVLDDFDHADDVVGSRGLAANLVEVENPEIVLLLQKVGIRPDVVAGEFEGASADGRPLAQEFQKPAGAAAEVEPAKRRTGRRRFAVAQEILREAHHVGELVAAVRLAVVAVFGFVVDVRVGAFSAVVTIVVDREAGEGFDELKSAGAAAVEREFLADECTALATALCDLAGAADAAHRGAHAVRAGRSARKSEAASRTAPRPARRRLRVRWCGQ